MFVHSRLRVDEVKLSVFVRVPEIISFPEDSSVIFESIVKSPVSSSVPSTVIEEPLSIIRFETSSIVTLSALAITGWFVTGGIVIILDEDGIFPPNQLPVVFQSVSLAPVQIKLPALAVVVIPVEAVFRALVIMGGWVIIRPLFVIVPLLAEILEAKIIPELPTLIV